MSSKNIQEPGKVQLFIGIMYNDIALLDKTLDILEKSYGKPMMVSDEYNFSAITTYYDKEMGPGIKKRIYAFGMIMPQDVVDIKLLTNDIEQSSSFLIGGHRRINLDPGYLDESQVVLVSSKERARRIYLGKGIYAELTLLFVDNAWKAMDWTYADFHKPEVQEFLMVLRKKYLNTHKNTKTDDVNACELVGAFDSMTRKDQ